MFNFANEKNEKISPFLPPNVPHVCEYFIKKLFPSENELILEQNKGPSWGDRCFRNEMLRVQCMHFGRFSVSKQLFHPFLLKRKFKGNQRARMKWCKSGARISQELCIQWRIPTFLLPVECWMLKNLVLNVQNSAKNRRPVVHSSGSRVWNDTGSNNL